MPRRARLVPWIDTNPGGFFIACWYDQEKRRTQRISLGTKDPVEAQARFAAFLTEGQPIREPSRLAGLTVSQALDDYWTEHVAVKTADPVRQENAIRHLKAWFADTRLRDVDIPMSRRYAAARRAGEIGGGRRKQKLEQKRGSDSTIRRELVTLKAAANHAVKWKRIQVTELPSIELPPEPTPDAIGEDEWLTRDELAKVLAAATGRLRDFIVLAYDSGSRREAIELMTKFQVDLRAGRVNLRSPGETPAQQRSKKRRPVVPIGPDARPVYERLLAETTTEYLFDTPTDMYRPFRKLMESLGLGRKRNPHILRHSRATHLLQDGVDIWSVAKLLGDTVKTVERVYGHACPEFLGETLQRRRTAEWLD
jgi:integrase